MTLTDSYRVTVAEERCTRCGICSTICPAGVISAKSDGLPRRPDQAASCIGCGHCEAVCSGGALSLDGPGLVPAPASPATAPMEPEALGRYLRMRRSVRHFLPAPVPRDTIAGIMDIVRYAPSGQNKQDVRWLIVHDTCEVRRYTTLAMDWMRKEAATGSAVAQRLNFSARVSAWEAGFDTVCRSAPHLVAAIAPETDPVSSVDAIIALSHLEIVAPCFGLGACWGGIFLHAATHHHPLQSALGLPSGHRLVHILMLGYPRHSYKRPPKRKPTNVIWK